MFIKLGSRPPSRAGLHTVVKGPGKASLVLALLVSVYVEYHFVCSNSNKRRMSPRHSPLLHTYVHLEEQWKYCKQNPAIVGTECALTQKIESFACAADDPEDRASHK